MWKLVESPPQRPATRKSNHHKNKINKSIAAFPLDRKRLVFVVVMSAVNLWKPRQAEGNRAASESRAL
jgi:hypothetical protein